MMERDKKRGIAAKALFGVVGAVVVAVVIAVVVAAVNSSKIGEGPVFTDADVSKIEGFFREHRSLFEDIRDGFGDCEGTIYLDEKGSPVVSLIDSCAADRGLLGGLAREYYSVAEFPRPDIEREEDGEAVWVKFLFYFGGSQRFVGIVYSQSSSRPNGPVNLTSLGDDWYFYSIGMT
jgi:hypothetical protein